MVARFTLDYWKTTSEVVAEYSNDVRRKQQADGYDRFNFSIKLADLANLEAKTMFFCVKYVVNGVEYWDNNNSTNFQVDFKKKPKPQNGKKGMQCAASRPAIGLPRSQKSAMMPQPRSKPSTFDDFADGFDPVYDLSSFAKKPVHDFLGESGTVRLKGVKSAGNLTTGGLGGKTHSRSGQAFANRYDFGASLTAAIQAANAALGDSDEITLKPSAKKQASPKPPSSVSVIKEAPKATTTSTSGTDSPRPIVADKPVLASQSYNELLDKYCFFGSSKSSPRLKDGTVSSGPGQYDRNEESYNYDSTQSSTSSSSNSSPAQQIQIDQRPSPQRMDSGTGGPAARAVPMTGFVTGTSPMYPYNRLGGFPLNETYAATAIRG